MRTTLNLADDVAAHAGALAREEGRSLSQVVNDLVRAGLRARQLDASPAPYDPPVFDTGRTFLDVTDVAATLEHLDDAG
jgi:hypothetical protein